MIIKNIKYIMKAIGYQKFFLLNLFHSLQQRTGKPIKVFCTIPVKTHSNCFN